MKGVDEYLDEELKTMPEQNPPEGMKSEFIEVCDEETQKVYDQIWTTLKT